MLGNMSISNTLPGEGEDLAPIMGVLTSTGNTATAVDLEWTAATDDKGISGYEIYVDGSLNDTIGDILTYTVSGLTTDQSYAFSVKAFDTANNRSDFSNVVNVTPSAVSAGLTPVLIAIPTQNDATWQLRTVSIGAYVGKQARLVISHKISANESSYHADVQVDDMKLGSTFWDPEVGTLNFETDHNSSTTTTYEGATFEPVIDISAGKQWNRHHGNTSSNSTGNTTGNTGDYYFYTESSGSVAGQMYWLRSPVVTIDVNVLEVYTAQNGAACGDINIYLDIQ